MTARNAGERAPELVILAVVLLCMGFFVKGFDSALGQAISCLLTSSILLGLLWLMPLPVAFWNHVRLPLIFFALALLWLAIVAGVRAVEPLSVSSLPFAPDLFLAKFLSVAAGLGALIIGAMLGWSGQRDLAVASVAGTITACSALGLLFRMLPVDLFLQSWLVFEEGRFHGLAGNANVMASAAGAVAALNLARGLSVWRHRGTSRWPRARWVAMAHGAAFLLNFTALVLTGSRFPMLLSVAAVVALCAYQAYRARWSMRQVAPPLIVVAVLVGLALILFSDVLLERVGRLGPEAMMRLSLWSHFYEIATSAPWTGYGPGAFPQANLYFLQFSNETLPGAWSVNSPHSILLQLWFVGGAPYLLLIVAGTILILYALAREFDLRAAGVRHIGLMLAVAIIMAVGLVDITLDVPATTNLSMLLIGIAWTSLCEGVNRTPGAAR